MARLRTVVLATLLLAPLLTVDHAAARTDPRGASGWLAVSAGEEHTCGIKDSGQLFCWGRDNRQQLGNGGGTVSRNAPRAVATLFADWVAVSAGNFHTCAIRANGRLYCWGDDDAGELGNGSTQNAKSTPYQVTGGHTDWESVSAGRDSTCGIRNGRAFCWGRDYEGQLGNGPPLADREAPGLLNGSFTDWAEVGVGESQACGRRDVGRLYCWGKDAVGVVGDGAGRTDRSAPVQVSGAHADWTSLSVGRLHACGIRGAGALWCWGFNSNQALGIGPGGPLYVFAPRLVSGGFQDWVAVEASQGRLLEFTCGIRSSGALYCWGPDSEGVMGDGLPATGIYATPNPVAGPGGYGAVTGGEEHACGLRGTELDCWGRDDHGQVGDGPPFTNRYSPVEIPA